MQSLAAPLVCLTVVELASIGPVSAQQRTHVAQSRRPTILGVYFNCTPRGGLPSPSGTALNGTITTRQAVGSRCGNPNQPVVQIIYTSRPGFRGQDEIYLYGPEPRRATIIVR